jgi:hypothetical protein
MTQDAQTQAVDDLDGTTGDDVTTVQFALDGVSYEIDLSERNAKRLREELSEFIASGRRVGRGVKQPRNGQAKVARAASASARVPEQAKPMRAWTRTQGFDAGERGRVPSSGVPVSEYSLQN